MFYRIKQFLRSLLARLSPADLTLIDRYLNPAEKELFFRLSRPDQVHSACVAGKTNGALSVRGQNDGLLIKAALLHDLGKIDSGLNPFNRSVYVLADHFFPSGLKKCRRWKSVRAYYDHPELALPYLEDQDDQLKFLVRHHHDQAALPEQNERLRLLQEMDGEC